MDKGINISSQGMQEIKKDLVQFFEQLWKRIHFEKDFKINGLIVCRGEGNEVVIAFNREGRGLERNPSLNMTKQKVIWIVLS